MMAHLLTAFRFVADVVAETRALQAQAARRYGLGDC
jgi:hypothetical protein